MNQQKCAPGYHEFESGPRWGVILGVSKCKRCGAIARREDFPNIYRADADQKGPVAQAPRGEHVVIEPKDDEGQSADAVAGTVE